MSVAHFAIHQLRNGSSWEGLEFCYRDAVAALIREGSKKHDLTRILIKLPSPLAQDWFEKQEGRVEAYLTSLADAFTNYPMLGPNKVKAALTHGLSDQLLLRHYATYRDYIGRFTDITEKHLVGVARAGINRTGGTIRQTLQENYSVLQKDLQQLGQELAQRYIALQTQSRANAKHT